MATDRANDPRAFQGFLEEKLTQGSVETLDDALSLWHDENRDEEDRTLTLEAIREYLADVEVGRVVLAREAIAELRRKYHLTELTRAIVSS